MHLICATHIHTDSAAIIYTSKYFDSALFDWWMRTALLWQAVCVCVCVHENQNKWSCVLSVPLSLSLLCGCIQIECHKAAEQLNSREAAAACAAEGACPNAINARCTYATNVINLQARKRHRHRARETELLHFVACCSWANCAELFMALRQVAWPSAAATTATKTLRRASASEMLKAGSTNCVTLHA